MPAQAALTSIVLAATYLLTDPSDNINFAFGPGKSPQRAMDPLAYLLVVMIVLPLIVQWPMHALLRRVVPPPR